MMPLSERGSDRRYRNAYYEFFKATHYLMAIVFMVFFFIHCGFTLTSMYANHPFYPSASTVISF